MSLPSGRTCHSNVLVWHIVPCKPLERKLSCRLLDRGRGPIWHFQLHIIILFCFPSQDVLIFQKKFIVKTSAGFSVMFLDLEKLAKVVFKACKTGNRKSMHIGNCAVANCPGRKQTVPVGKLCREATYSIQAGKLGRLSARHVSKLIRWAN
jgi:hypothetical protein